MYVISGNFFVKSFYRFYKRVIFITNAYRSLTFLARIMCFNALTEMSRKYSLPKSFSFFLCFRRRSISVLENPYLLIITCYYAFINMYFNNIIIVITTKKQWIVPRRAIKRQVNISNILLMYLFCVKYNY